MKLTAIAAGMTLVCALSACGGGGSSSNANGETAPATTKPNVQPQSATTTTTTSLPTALIESYGDSTMYGFSSTSPTDGAYTMYNAPYYLQQDLQGIYGTRVTVTDQGVGATTMNQLISGSDGVHATWTKQMQQSSANIVIVNHALNDDVVGETLDQYRALLIEFVSTARQYGKTPVLEEPNPSCDPQRANLGDYVHAMDRVAQEMNVPLVSQWAYIQTLPNWQGYLADCIHPNPALYQIKAQREAVVVAPLVANILN